MRAATRHWHQLRLAKKKKLKENPYTSKGWLYLLYIYQTCEENAAILLSCYKSAKVSAECHCPFSHPGLLG